MYEQREINLLRLLEVSSRSDGVIFYIGEMLINGRIHNIKSSTSLYLVHNAADVFFGVGNYKVVKVDKN